MAGLYEEGNSDFHLREYVPSHPDGAKDDYAELAARFVELEIEAHPDLAGLPVSALQIDNKGDLVWLAKGACDARQSDRSNQT